MTPPTARAAKFYGVATKTLTDGLSSIPAGSCVTVTLIDGDPFTAGQYRVTDDTATVWLRAELQLMVDAA